MNEKGRVSPARPNVSISEDHGSRDQGQEAGTPKEIGETLASPFTCECLCSTAGPIIDPFADDRAAFAELERRRRLRHAADRIKRRADHDDVAEVLLLLIQEAAANA